MKFRYAVTYAKLNSDVKDVKAAFAEHIKVAEKAGLKVPFWGSPWGTDDDIIILYEFDKISLYEKYMEEDRKNPFHGGRTNLVFEW